MYINMGIHMLQFQELVLSLDYIGPGDRTSGPQAWWQGPLPTKPIHGCF